MVICYFNVERVTATPFETDSPLVINSDAMLSCTITAKFFKSIRRWNSQVVEVNGVVDHTQLSQSCLLNIGWKLPRTLALINLFCFSILEGFDHRVIIWCGALNVKRYTRSSEWMGEGFIRVGAEDCQIQG